MTSPHCGYSPLPRGRGERGPPRCATCHIDHHPADHSPIPKRPGHHPSRSHDLSSFAGALLSYLATERNLVQDSLSRHTQRSSALLARFRGHSPITTQPNTAGTPCLRIYIVPARNIEARDDLLDACDAGCEWAPHATLASTALCHAAI
ncbi:hypothetical protein BV22DRAFT_1038549 [Leucogyrophana mollusca]|uniref:Uncharacterized protein n=1 Tax=Leucogyrophana mollusca TaxID=85980 RepID=A0ACB8B6X4_9AGAM|nr:hypothetical protein BV22DRAFT_1038549 [Leucogyrophana mollusca]